MNRFSLFLLSFILVLGACTKEFGEQVPQESLEKKRMPFNERVFLLNNVSGESRIYELDYDFQGLADEATLNRLTTSKPIPSGGHMTISPDKKWITIVISKRSKIYLVEVATGNVKEIQLLKHDPEGINKNNLTQHYNSNRFKGKITQVDVDQEGFLFLAGKSGFFKVVADNGNGSQDPSAVNGGPDIWYDEDKTLNGSQYEGQVWAHAVKFKFSGENYVETTDDGENYFEDATPFNPKKVKFRGGDILFTQNSSETDGFEQQRLISFSQWKGNTAIALDLNWDWSNQTISFNAGQVFGGNIKHAFHRKNKSEDKKGTERVTGAALTGDNFVFTSHHKRDYLNLWNLHGDLVTQVKFTINEADGSDTFKDGKKIHNWGDMTSTQAFDKVTQNTKDDVMSNKEINGEYYDEWYRGDEEGHQYAEVKLYRPGMIPADYEVADLSNDNYNVSRESRRNAANADIADYRKNASKFVSLGKNNGYVLMRLPEPIVVTENTILQVVETSWNKAAQYESMTEAFRAYAERANVFVLPGNTQRYYTAGLEKHLQNDWVYVNKAHIANNEFTLGNISGPDKQQLIGQTIQWIMIRDQAGNGGSRTPDGFDINFVATYEKEEPCTPLVESLASMDEVLVPGLFNNNNFHITTMGAFKIDDSWYSVIRLRNGYADAKEFVVTENGGGITRTVTVPAGSEIFYVTPHFGTFTCVTDVVGSNGKLRRKTAVSSFGDGEVPSKIFTSSLCL